MADHGDPPAVAGMGDRDITDIYAFHPPGSGMGAQVMERMVLVLAVNPLTEPPTMPTFSDEADYLLLVDTDGDADEDIEIEFEFEEPEGGVQAFEFEMEGGGSEFEGEGITGTTMDLGGGAKVFAGLRDDPFFADLGFVFGPAPAGGDSLMGLNVSAIVLEVPTSALTPEGSAIGVWGAVEGSDQIDRMGRPGISSLLVTRKDLYNTSEPDDDVENFRDEVIANIVAGFPKTEAQAAGLADVLLPDILTVDTSSATAFLNGRKLDDDVIDAALGLLIAPGTSDGVPANDVPFLTTFPYLAGPHV